MRSYTVTVFTFIFSFYAVVSYCVYIWSTANAHLFNLNVWKCKNRSKIGRFNRILNFFIQPNSILNRILVFLIQPNSFGFWTSWFYPTHFSDLLLIQKIMVIWNRNWDINTIDGHWPWYYRFYYFYPQAWASAELPFGLPLYLFLSRDIRYFCGCSRAYCSILSWKGYVILVSWVNRWWWWLETTDDSLSPILILIQIVYIYDLQLNTLLNVYLVHANYLL